MQIEEEQVNIIEAETQIEEEQVNIIEPSDPITNGHWKFCFWH
jgi:hypothetical protein